MRTRCRFEALALLLAKLRLLMWAEFLLCGFTMDSNIFFQKLPIFFIDTPSGLCYSIGCIIVQECTPRDNYAQKQIGDFWQKTRKNVYTFI